MNFRTFIYEILIPSCVLAVVLVSTICMFFYIGNLISNDIKNIQITLDTNK